MSQLNVKISEQTGLEMLDENHNAFGFIKLNDEMIVELMEYHIRLFEDRNYFWGKTLDIFNPKGINKWFYANKRFITFDEYKKYVELPIDKQDLIVSNKISHALRQKSKEEPDDILQHYYSLMMEKAPEMANFFFSDRPFKIPTKDKYAHVYVVAMSGSGKSELLKSFIKDDIIRNEDGIIVIDPNGDFAEQIAQFKQNLQSNREDKTIYIDPSLSEFVLPVINPFELPEEFDYFNYANYQNLLEPRAGQITSALAQIFTDLDSNFSPKMNSYLLPAVCAVLLKKNGGFDDLLRLFGEGDNEDLLELGRKSPNEIHRHEFKKWDIPHTTRDGIRDKIKLLLQYSKFRDLVTGKSTINLDKAIAENKLIIFNLSKGILGEGVSKYYGKLMISLIQSCVMARAYLPQSKRTNTKMYVDEFHNYINNTIKEMLQDARKYGFYLYLASQQTGQDMDAGIKASVYGNTKIKIIGTQQDPSSIKTVSGFLDMKVDEVKTIPFHNFYVKIGTRKAFKMTTTTENLGTKNSMTFEQWKVFKDRMLSLYYRKRNEYRSQDFTNIPPEENEFKFNPKYED